MTPETARKLDEALREQEVALSRGVPQDYRLFDIVASGLVVGEMVLRYQLNSDSPKWNCRIPTERLLVALISIL